MAGVALAAAASAALAPGAAAAPAFPATAAAPGPATVLANFVRAAGKGDAAAMWALLSAPSRKRLGPDLARFRSGAAVELGEGLGSYSRSGSFTVRYSVVLSPQWAFVAITGRRSVEGQVERGAYAVALRGEPGGWRVELGSPVKVRILGPHEGEVVRQPQPQVAIEVKANKDIVGALLLVDGVSVDAKSGGLGPRAITFYGVANLVRTTSIHYGAAIAATATDATGVAWAFEFVPRKAVPAQTTTSPR